MIDRFDGEYRFLSSFWFAEVSVPDVLDPSDPYKVTLPTVEHAYVVMKVGAWAEFRVQAGLELTAYRGMSPGRAKRLGRTVTLQPGWHDKRVSIMEFLLRQKFAPGTELAKRLLATGDEFLMEGNNWHDQFWGNCQCARCVARGSNHLGKLIMKIRAEFWEVDDGDPNR